MEIFWLIMGIGILLFAAYSYVNDLHSEDIKYFIIAGSMAIILSLFRRFYRTRG
jgi:hypothetical protein